MKYSKEVTMSVILVTIEVELHEGDKLEHEAVQAAVNHGHYTVIKTESVLSPEERKP